MRVLAVSEDTYNICGFYLGFVNLVRELSYRTHLTLLIMEGASAKTIDDLCRVERLRLDYGSIRQLGLTKTFVKYLKICQAIIRQMRKSGMPDVILVNYDTSAIVSLIISRFFGIQIVVLIWEVNKSNDAVRITRNRENLKLRLIRFFDAVIVPNNTVKRAVSEYVDHNRITPIGAVVPVMPRIMNRDRHKIVSIGVLEPKKHVEELLAAIQVLRSETQEDFQVYWIGDGSLLNHLRTVYSNLPWFHFMGQVIEDEKWNMLSSSFVYCCCSESEGFNIPFVESMACGTPIVTYGLEIYNEMWGDSIIQVDWGDRVSFARAIEKIHYHEDAWNEASLRVRSSYEKYSSHMVAETAIDLLEDLVSERDEN